MPMGGGGGGGGGAVVSQVSPLAGFQAAGFQSVAAQAAADAAKQQTADAINLIRNQYNNAFMSLKPYTSEGIQALNELNSYMGLNAYNPGTAPRAPTAPTIESLAAQVTRPQIAQYVNSLVNANIDKGGFYGWYNYGGPGSELLQKNYNGATGQWQQAQLSQNTSDFYNNPVIRKAVAESIAQDNMSLAQRDYQSQLDTYNQQMDLYNQAKTAYENYEGPLTPEQVQEKLMAQPGVGFQYNQGLDAIQRAASAKGQIGSGRVMQALSDYGQGMASQQYGQTLSRLAGLVEMGQNAATGQANLSSQLGNTTGQLTSNLGDTIANSFLAQGNAMAGAITNAGTGYRVIGGGGGGGGLGGLGSLLGGAASLMGSGSTGSGLLGLFG